MVTLTKTNITDYMICPWMYYLNQVQGYFPKRMSNAVGVGLLFHGAMETWAKKGEEAAHEYVSKEVMRSFNENKLDPTFKPEKLELNKAMVTGMLEGYPYAVIADAVEVEFSIDFYGFKLAGKWDGDYKDGTRTYLFDYKTKGRIPEFNHGIMARDLQGQLYFHAARQMGMDVDGFEHIIVKRTGLIHGKKETYAMYLQRVRADYSIPKRQDAYYDRQQILYDPDDQKFWANLRSHLPPDASWIRISTPMTLSTPTILKRPSMVFNACGLNTDARLRGSCTNTISRNALNTSVIRRREMM